MVREDHVGVGTFVQKEVGVVCGLPVVEMVCRAYDERLRVEMIPGSTWRSSRAASATPAARRCCASAGRCGRCSRPSGSC
jgi:hypothetical protein